MDNLILAVVTKLDDTFFELPDKWINQGQILQRGVCIFTTALALRSRSLVIVWSDFVVFDKRLQRRRWTFGRLRIG